jgi:prepilin-type N-terminal cleavage/methylation domain-containing protein
MQTHAIRRRAWSLLEMLVVMVVIGVLLRLSAQSYHRAVEQSRADVAAAGLRSIWAAQRLFWLDQRQYTKNFSDLAPLLDPSIATGTQFYTYALVSTDGTTFSATATRIGSTVWTGLFTIDQTGQLTGSIQGDNNTTIVAGFQ